MSIDKYTIPDNLSIYKTLKTMNDRRIKYVITINQNKQVTGTVTDGDIRRGILKDVDVNDGISTISNKKFLSVNENDVFEKIVRTFYEYEIEFIPILFNDGSLKNIMTKRILDGLLLTNNALNYDYNFDDYDKREMEHDIIVRPWGCYKTMAINDVFQSKMIYLLPKQCLSLQSHQHRDEYWTIINGNGRVQLDNKVVEIGPGYMTKIPKGCLHRIFNDSTVDNLVFAEIQLGDYFGEDDICRLEDNYGR